MKMSEEWYAIKEEAENLNKKIAELSEDEVEQVSGSGQTQTDIDGYVRIAMNILGMMKLYPSEDYVRFLIEEGGNNLRDWALDNSDGDPKAYSLPSINSNTCTGE